MGISVLNPPAVSGGKTRKVETLTSGSSWTVPAGVTHVNVTLVGGGGGGGAAGCRTDQGFSKGGTGGTTTFTGATSASGGYGGNSMVSSGNLNRNNYSDGNNGINHGDGGDSGWSVYYNQAYIPSDHGSTGGIGQRIQSTVTTTPGNSINYSIGSGGTSGYAGISGTSPNHTYGGVGASGKIEIEYWV